MNQNIIIFDNLSDIGQAVILIPISEKELKAMLIHGFILRATQERTTWLINNIFQKGKGTTIIDNNVINRNTVLILIDNYKYGINGGNSVFYRAKLIQ